MGIAGRTIHFNNTTPNHASGSRCASHQTNLVRMNATGHSSESLADQLSKAENTQKIKELIMLLEEAIFNRQQELALLDDHAGTTLRKALELMLNLKITRLGFPDIR